MRFLLLIFFIAGLADPLAAQDKRPDRNWPFSMIQEVQPPVIADLNSDNPIDFFVQGKLTDNGLELANPATRDQLIRRLYFDLLGLPPSPEDIQRFLEDHRPDAYEKLVDRLLKDPRYGERWARFWLDLARYADTAGYEGDPDLPHAWRYRDYVIDAFNNDKPYDLFIREQIAGDEFEEVMGAGDLPSTPAERIVALTFLRLAPFTEPRGDESRHELLSEMTSTVGSVFLGLTVGCAKCHDHKHDNIPTRDFYRMKAFFATVSIPRPEPGDGFQIGGPIAAKFYRPKENDWATAKKAKLNSELSSAKVELEKLTTKLTNRIGSHSGFGIQAMGGSLGNDYWFEQNKVNDGQMHWSIINANQHQWDFFTDGKKSGRLGTKAGANRGAWFGGLQDPGLISLGQYTAGQMTIADAKAHHVGNFGEILIYDRPLDAADRQVLSTYIKAKYHLGQEAVPPEKGLSFWLDASDLGEKASKENASQGSKISTWTDKVSGIRLVQSDENLQPVITSLGKARAVRFDNDFLIGKIGPTPGFLKKSQGAVVVVYSASHQHEGYGFQIGGNGQFISTFVNPAAGQGSDLVAAINNPQEDRITRDEKQRFQYLRTRETFVPQHLKRLRPVAMSLRHSYGPPYEPGVPTSRVMIRGEYNNPGEVVEPGFLSCITGHQQPAAIRLDPFKRWPTRSRRKALADWIASPDNPLTARVMVNRLWQWHFGQGIVVTPSDFGALSGGPSHPKLLDWLARKFIEEKWSVKKMHRWIVTSNTYRQSSIHPNPKAEAIDPDNRLLWKFNRRRLEAEAVRDAVLHVSGRLNPQMYGLPCFPPLPDDIANRVKYSNSKWDTQYGVEGRRRSIYIYQQRTLTMPLMQSFDSLVCEQSRPRRRHSVTPLQALAMWNGQFVDQEAQCFSERVRQQAGDSRQNQIKLAFQIAFSRVPTHEESEKMMLFMQRAKSGDQALFSLCRVLLNSNEFIYID